MTIETREDGRSPPLRSGSGQRPSGVEPASAVSSIAATPNAGDLSKDERGFLLYAETCCVDGGGLLVGVRMNSDDFDAARKFQVLGLMFFGRIPAKMLNLSRNGGATHYVELTEEGWQLAHILRRERASQRGPYATAVFGHELVLERMGRTASAAGARSDETAQQAQAGGRQSGGEAATPNTGSDQ